MLLFFRVFKFKSKKDKPKENEKFDSTPKTSYTPLSRMTENRLEKSDDSQTLKQMMKFNSITPNSM